MFCDWCNDISYAVQTTIRLTKDGHEITIEYCGHCMRRTETEYFNGPTTHIHVDTAKRPAKRI
jgi:methionine aminopeptidase